MLGQKMSYVRIAHNSLGKNENRSYCVNCSLALCDEYASARTYAEGHNPTITPSSPSRAESLSRISTTGECWFSEETTPTS